MQTKTKITLALAAVTAVGGLLAGIAALADGGGSTANKSGGDINVGTGANGGCYVAGHDNVVECPSPASITATGASDSAIAHSISRSATPAGEGPWAFTVLHDDVGGRYLGLWIRSSPNRAGYHIGLALHLAPVFVDCVKTTRFDPDPGTGSGPRWYKVHWPNSKPSESSEFSSSPSDPAQGWAYAYYLSPNGTNGQVRQCA